MDDIKTEEISSYSTKANFAHKEKVSITSEVIESTNTRTFHTTEEESTSRRNLSSGKDDMYPRSSNNLPSGSLPPLGKNLPSIGQVKNEKFYI